MALLFVTAKSGGIFFCFLLFSFLDLPRSNQTVGVCVTARCSQRREIYSLILTRGKNTGEPQGAETCCLFL